MCSKARALCVLMTRPEEEEEALLRHPFHILLAAPHPLSPACFMLLLLLLLGGSIAHFLSLVFCLPP